MASIIGRVALGGVCAGMALYVAMHSEDETIQATAALASSCMIGFTVTSVALEHHRERKNREMHADAYLELLQQIHAQRPSLPNQPAACQGCQHYHGRMYGGSMLVCGMHPYGVEDDRCPDWEGQTDPSPDEESI